MNSTKTRSKRKATWKVFRDKRREWERTGRCPNCGTPISCNNNIYWRIDDLEVECDNCR